MKDMEKLRRLLAGDADIAECAAEAVTSLEVDTRPFKEWAKEVMTPIEDGDVNRYRERLHAMNVLLIKDPTFKAAVKRAHDEANARPTDVARLPARALIDTMLSISDVHLSKETRDQLEIGACKEEWGLDWTSAPRPGWVIYDDDRPSMPPDLLAIQNLAAELDVGCMVITINELRNDANKIVVIEELPILNPTPNMTDALAKEPK